MHASQLVCLSDWGFSDCDVNKLCTGLFRGGGGVVRDATFARTVDASVGRLPSGRVLYECWRLIEGGVTVHFDKMGCPLPRPRAAVSVNIVGIVET